MISLKKLALSSILATSILSAPAMAETYVIDTKGAHAFINFKIKHLGYSWLYGRFNEFSGEFTYDPAKLTESKINVTINTNSIDSNHAERDKHLRNEEFFNTAKHPKAEFVSTKIEPKDNDRFNVYGNLTLNGTTKEIVIAAEKIGQGDDPWGGYRAGFAGTTEIVLKDFNINYDLGPSATTAYLELTIEGVRQK